MSNYLNTGLTRDEVESRMYGTKEGRAKADREIAAEYDRIEKTREVLRSYKSVLPDEQYKELMKDFLRHKEDPLETILARHIKLPAKEEPKKAKKAPKAEEPVPKKTQRRITVDQYDTLHDKYTMAKDEVKYLQTIIKQLQKHITKLEK